MPFLILAMALMHSTVLASTLQISEMGLLKYAVNSPQLLRSKASAAGQDYQSGLTLDQFSWKAKAGIAQSDTREKPLISFQPIFAPNQGYHIELSKKLSLGLTASTKLDLSKTEFTLQGDFNKKSILIGSASISMDLWSNLLGRLDRSYLAIAKVANKKEKLQQKVNQNVLNYSIRNLYWQLVGNNESLIIAQKLLDKTTKQSLDATKRFRQSVSDEGEVARYRALVSQRQAQMASLQYQRNLLHESLKQLLPDISTYELVLAPYQLDKTLDEILACTASIITFKDVPYDVTPYDEMVSLLEESYRHQSKISKEYWAPSITLDAMIQTKGIGNTSKLARDDISDNDPYGHAIGLNLSIPFGAHYGETEKAKLLQEKLLFQAQKKELMNKLTNLHNSIKKSIPILNQTIKSQQSNSIELKKRIKNISTKYKQARVSLSDLINDENTLLGNELDLINTKLTIIRTIFDYFSVFPDFNCAFNKKAAPSL